VTGERTKRRNRWTEPMRKGALGVASSTLINKCLGEDTKAAAHQSLNCIKNKKSKFGEKRFSIWQIEFLHPAMWHNHDIDFARRLHPAMWHGALESWQWIHQVAAPCNIVTSGCDDMPLNSPKRPPYWNSTFGFDFDHITAVYVTLHQSPKFYQNRTTLGRKKWRHVDFQDGGSQPSWILGIQ